MTYEQCFSSVLIKDFKDFKVFKVKSSHKCAIKRTAALWRRALTASKTKSV